MSYKTDKRLALYLGESTEDTLFRNRIEVASDTLGVSISKLLRESAKLCARQRFGPTGEAAVTLSYEQYFRRNVERFTRMVERAKAENPSALWLAEACLASAEKRLANHLEELKGEKAELPSRMS